MHGNTDPSWRDRIRALGPMIDAQGAAVDGSGATEIDRVVVETLDAMGVYALMAPREVGGGEAHPSVLIDVISELSYWDGSTGWYAHAVMTGGAVAGAFLGANAVAAIFPGGRFLHAAGQAAPTGKAERTRDGYRISGRYSFGSGTPHARFIVGGFVPGDDPDTMLIGLVPRDRVVFKGNWDVMGLRGTGSYDFEVPEQELHADFFLEAGVASQKRGGTLYRMGFMALPCLSHAAFALGATRRMLDEWLAFAKTKQRGPGVTASALPTFHRDIAVLTAEARAAEAFVRRTFDRLFEAAEAGAVPDDLRLDGRLCANHALTVAVRAAQAAYASATTGALRNASTLQRVFRDIQAGNAHVLTGEGSVLDAGKTIAERTPIVF
jgi:alkylation response protein AidB-like acyl-CoA dehydrogenase